MYNAQDIISKCLEGKAAHDIIKEFEEELPDIQSVKMNLMNDLRNSGIDILGIDVKEEGTNLELNLVLDESNQDTVNSIIQTYSYTYPEIEVFLKQ